MNKSYLLALAAALLAAPLTMATHAPAGLGLPKITCEDPSIWNNHEYWVPSTGFAVFLLTDGNLEDCDGDTIPADFDDHSEFALGGAWLMVDSGDGVTDGSLACYGEAGHHPTFGPFTVVDAVIGAATPFLVASDTENLVPPTDPAEPDCGDFTTDNSTQCVGTCTVTFTAGIDGTYILYVGDLLGGTPGTGGQIWSPGP